MCTYEAYDVLSDDLLYLLDECWDELSRECLCERGEGDEGEREWEHEKSGNDEKST